MKVPAAVLVLLPVFALASSSTESANPESFTPAETLATFPLPDKIADSGPCVDLNPDDCAKLVAAYPTPSDTATPSSTVTTSAFPTTATSTTARRCEDLHHRCPRIIAADPSHCKVLEIRAYCKKSCQICDENTTVQATGTPIMSYY